MMRSASVHIAGRLSYREAIEALWLKHPTLTMVRVRSLTGAPCAVVRNVYAQLRAAGKLQPPRNGIRDYWRAVGT